MKKKLLIVSFLIFLSNPVWASPFLVCDPYPTTSPMPDYFLVKIGPAEFVKSIPVDVSNGKILKYSLANVAIGEHKVEVKACQIDAIWGEVCSDSAVFTFRRPSAPSAPKNVSLSR